MPLFLPHFNLQKHNTLAVPAVADWFVSITNDTELREALAWAGERSLPLLVLGGGSNLVLRDDFHGLVIHIRSQGKILAAENEQYVWLQVAAGENWHQLVEYTLAEGLFGLENLSLIPGSVGAAPIQNIGAYGVELCDVFAELSAMEIASGLSVTFTAESCHFGYRDSIFKNALNGKYIITQVTLKLSREPRLVLDYPALREELKAIPMDQLTPEKVSEAVIAIRRSKLPDPANMPNAGSFFKNPIVDGPEYQRLIAAYPDLVAYPQADGHFKLAAAWLIDRAGWRGRQLAGAAVHEYQALVLTNPQRLPGSAVLALAGHIVQSVEEQFGVTLEMEPRIYP
ncbi:UDP-N-acetylmuramate dehydrogenase [Cellvibrio japonicus]|uniref:UDP-N-acetylenolpyruvoylglucosamine reductase n=1 Tax=Cellvibrio japonicus (strain Ueda107) TaxID=498211 RepID=B3PFS1_CELJU|nr:UDP-N-acetylmuramate dehydrogenase [Cellvibrio japonicus]ACE85323.1 UDP-N-acetylpyruvoylglucosamine reductase [Cellvibrio japonicus Ueda107]QEI12294.1 UDP-N-acetylmuramate dehydrogenase [Cellvibrio japonicus]QEI15868.1 UDP-N-acetylmuramate dehydrogenase [Cellvibrio japonicus]QEI19446.1 UDP-N-acetylmuramate dehydrogenase [Cellvibrio japonicus]